MLDKGFYMRFVPRFFLDSIELGDPFDGLFGNG
jgi:hypothetical protein